METSNAERSAIISAQLDSERRERFPFINEENVDEVLEWEEQREQELTQL